MENNDDFHTTSGLLVQILRLMVGMALLGVAILIGLGWIGFVLFKFKVLTFDTTTMIISVIVLGLGTTGVMQLRRAMR